MIIILMALAFCAHADYPGSMYGTVGILALVVADKLIEWIFVDDCQIRKEMPKCP